MGTTRSCIHSFPLRPPPTIPTTKSYICARSLCIIIIIIIIFSSYYGCPLLVLCVLLVFLLSKHEISRSHTWNHIGIYSKCGMNMRRQSTQQCDMKWKKTHTTLDDRVQWKLDGTWGPCVWAWAFGVTRFEAEPTGDGLRCDSAGTFVFVSNQFTSFSPLFIHLLNETVVVRASRGDDRRLVRHRKI